MSIVIIVSIYKTLTPKTKKTKKQKLRILVSSSGCHTQSSPSVRTPQQMEYVGFRAKARATHYEVAQRNTTFFRVMGNVGRIVKDDFLNPHRTLVRRYRCTTYITNAISIRMQAAMTNVESKYLCQTPNMRGSVSKGYAIMTSSLTSSMTKSQQKEF